MKSPSKRYKIVSAKNSVVHKVYDSWSSSMMVVGVHHNIKECSVQRARLEKDHRKELSVLMDTVSDELIKI